VIHGCFHQDLTSSLFGVRRATNILWQMHTTRASCKLHGKKATRLDSGYALLLVVFFVALLLVTVLLAKPNLITQDRRQKEVEMIWRGQQYVRGIRLYYQKVHHFPQQLDDLYKPKTGIRFMRQPYTDPMNKEDGSWRLIYVGPMGQIIGSVNPQYVLIANSVPPTASSLAGPLAPPSVSPTDPLSSSLPSTIGNAANAQQPSSGPQSMAQAPDASSQVVAQNSIIGVGSKIDKGSIMLFEGQKNYKSFEFIYRAVTQDPRTVIPNP
jgi:hypothetical protein